MQRTNRDGDRSGATDLGSPRPPPRGPPVRLTTQSNRGSPCGTCTGLVEQVLGRDAGDEFVMPAAAAICGCTDMTHEGRAAHDQITTPDVIARGLAGMRMEDVVAAAMSGRPALNFYLFGALAAGIQEEIRKSRFINERQNTPNIQKAAHSASCSVCGGRDYNADELRAIADARRPNIWCPRSRFTGGQAYRPAGVRVRICPISGPT